MSDLAPFQWLGKAAEDDLEFLCPHEDEEEAQLPAYEVIQLWMLEAFG